MKDQKPLRQLIVIIILTTLGTFLFSYIAFVTMQDKFPLSFLMIWNRWDTPHYIYIAENGYTNMGEESLFIVFFPFYPFLIKLFTLVFKNYIFSALVISNLSYAISVFYLYKLVLLDYTKETALRAVFYFSIFPTAYFLHAGYTESLFLALTISSFYYSRLEKWWLSGLLGMIASVTRITGVILLPALIVEYLISKERIGNIKRDILWLALIPLGLVFYLIINYITFDNPLKFLEIQKEHWSKTLAFPWEGFLGAWKSIWWRTPYEKVLVGWAELIFGVFGLFLNLWIIMRLRLSYSIYMLIIWLVVTSTSYWLSIPRYTLSMFPLFIAISLFGEQREINYLISFVSILFFGLFLSLFVQGKWAF